MNAYLIYQEERKGNWRMVRAFSDKEAAYQFMVSIKDEIEFTTSAKFPFTEMDVNGKLLAFANDEVRFWVQEIVVVS